jgi:magnesium chelatase subunit D
VGAVRGDPRHGARLALIETLRAAAPWQRWRRQAAHGGEGRVLITRDDLHVQRRIQRRATTTIFAIDASGSQALHRLAEAKGAVELLLADCYARRDQVAVIGFRGRGAELLLPPTRSLVRAKRQLAGLPGGGGTPLAAGIDAAHALATRVQRGGATPLVVLLTDGRANLGRDGSPGREAALRDALASARALRGSGIRTLLIDTSPQPGPAAAQLAEALAAPCIALPHAQADTVSRVVRQERGASAGGQGHGRV